jgi:methionine-rich copper-binding protein CopC
MRRIGRLGAVVALLAAVLTTALPTGPAQAHGDLLGTRTPAAGEVLQVFPSEVRLQFTARLAPVDPVVVVRHADGRSVTAGPPVVDVFAVAQPLVPDGGDGTYEVSWEVVAEDGHPASGTYVFAVGDPAEVPASADPAAAAPSPSASNTDTAGDGVAPGVLAGGAAAALLLGLLTAFLLRRRRRSTSS